MWCACTHACLVHMACAHACRTAHIRVWYACGRGVRRVRVWYVLGVHVAFQLSSERFGGTAGVSSSCHFQYCVTRQDLESTAESPHPEELEGCVTPTVAPDSRLQRTPPACITPPGSHAAGSNHPPASGRGAGSQPRAPPGPGPEPHGIADDQARSSEGHVPWDSVPHRLLARLCLADTRPHLAEAARGSLQGQSEGGARAGPTGQKPQFHPSLL